MRNKHFINVTHIPVSVLETNDIMTLDSMYADNKRHIIDMTLKTEKSSRYLLSSDGKTRRLKHAGCEDDGFYNWCDKCVFLDNFSINSLMSAMQSVLDNFKPVKVDVNENVLKLSKIVDGQWDVIGEYEVKELDNGLHPLELWLDGDGIVKNFHFGHKVIDFIKVA